MVALRKLGVGSRMGGLPLRPPIAFPTPNFLYATTLRKLALAFYAPFTLRIHVCLAPRAAGDGAGDGAGAAAAAAAAPPVSTSLPGSDIDGARKAADFGQESGS